MGFRYRRRVKIAPGVHLNLSKRGTSVSLGGHGVTENFSKRGRRTTYSLRGTGLSYVTKTSKASGCGCAIPMLVFGVAFVALTASFTRRIQNRHLLD
ncbi:MAG TPA: DUF4236 domain-containing protein [Nitrolancea sp.]|jgi:hypothetical protein|nr:DUF4236 domain-containing protein [Nitrolancea sp.]